MASTCRDCFNNCDGNVTSDKCVKYTGPTIDWLGICTGDSLSMLEAALIEKLGAVLDGTGTGIVIEDLESCEILEDELLTQDPTLKNILQAIFNVICAMQEDIEGLEDSTENPLSFSADCLDLEDNPTRDDILQAVVTRTCSNSFAIETISSDYVKASELCSLVADCLEASEEEDIIQQYSLMPKYVALPYHGPLSVFDASGKGLASAGYDKVYMCVGQVVNGFALPDYRGRTPVGANIGMPGGVMDSNVDPSLAANVGYNINQGLKKGNFTHTLTTPQLAAHSHGVNDPGHEHDLDPYVTDAAGGLSYQSLKGDSDDNGPNPISTTVNTTGITIDSTGSSQPHNNTQPSMGTVFIMYIP